MAASQKSSATAAAMAANHRRQETGLSVNTNISRAPWEQTHSAPGGGNGRESFNRRFTTAPAPTSPVVPDSSTQPHRRRGCRAGRAVRERHAARASEEAEATTGSEGRSSQDLVYEREELKRLQETSAFHDAQMKSRLSNVVKIDGVGELKDLGTGDEGSMILTVTTLTSGEKRYISSDGQDVRMPLSELHLARSRGRQERGEDDHDFATVRKATRPVVPRANSVAPEFLKRGAGRRLQQIQQVRGARQACRQDPAIRAIGVKKISPEISPEDSLVRSPQYTRDDRFESLLARLRTLVGSDTNSGSAGSEFGIRNGIFPPRETKGKDEEKDRAKTFNPNATEFVPVQQDGAASVGIGFQAKPISFLRKAVNGIFSAQDDPVSPGMPPAVPASPVLAPAQPSGPIPEIPLELMDPAIIAYSPARPAVNPPIMPFSMPPPLGLGGIGGHGPCDLISNPFTPGVPPAPVALPPGLGFGFNPVPVPPPNFQSFGPMHYPPPPPRPVRKPRIPDSRAQMQYEQYLEERRARDPHGYALECRRRQAARWKRQGFPACQQGGPSNAPPASDINKKERKAASTSSTNTASTQTGSDESTGTVDRKNIDVSTASSASDQTKQSSKGTTENSSGSKEGGIVGNGEGPKTLGKERKKTGASAAGSPLVRAKGRTNGISAQ